MRDRSPTWWTNEFLLKSPTGTWIELLTDQRWLKCRRIVAKPTSTLMMALKSCIPEYTCGRSPVDPRGSSWILRGPESRPQQLFTASISLGLSPTEPYEIQLSRTSKIYFLSLRKCPFLPEGNGSHPGKLPYYNTKLYQQLAQVFCFAVLWFLFACLFVWWWGCYSL